MNPRDPMSSKLVGNQESIDCNRHHVCSQLPPGRAHGKTLKATIVKPASEATNVVKPTTPSPTGYTPDSEIRQDRDERIDDGRSDTRHGKGPLRVIDLCTYLTDIKVTSEIVHTDAAGPTRQSESQGPLRSEVVEHNKGSEVPVSRPVKMRDVDTAAACGMVPCSVVEPNR